MLAVVHGGVVMAFSLAALTLLGMVRGTLIHCAVARVLVLGRALFGRQMAHRAMIDLLLFSLMRSVFIVSGVILCKGRGADQSCAGK